AYKAGIVASGANLAKAPIIDLRGWDDSLVTLPPGTPPSTGIHHMWFSWAIRDRITRDFGDAQNQALWRFSRGNFSIPPGTMGLEAFNAMDKWLTALFTTGVCDWSKPGVGQQAAVSPLTFKAGPGGQPLGEAPRSTRQ